MVKNVKKCFNYWGKVQIVCKIQHNIVFLQNNECVAFF